MINQPPPFKGLNIRIPIIIPIKGRGFIHQGSTLSHRSDQEGYHMSHNLSSLKGVIWGITWGTTIGVIKGDTRSLDNGSHSL